MFQRKIPISVHMNLLFGPFGAKLIVPIFCFYMLMYVSLFNSLRANRTDILFAIPFLIMYGVYYLFIQRKYMRTIKLLRIGRIAKGTLKEKKQTIVAERGFLSGTQYYYKYTFRFNDVNGKRHFCTEWSTTDNDFERRKEASIVYAPHIPKKAIALGLLYGGPYVIEDRIISGGKPNITTVGNGCLAAVSVIISFLLFL
ncbi:hypothetical protein QJQ58_09360 [Paenibacillus dendritiformis]|uniref:hypothetical protein n=1 Tax=Paenibacillus dendritiformis TaxID=130049 RepID=UPI00248AB9DE|nr:hypothetical protein [Paenibacillus dendritiformis]WGU96420.1 hypothetical protein QJQ58_09360 [Paenibacillus dendritiformis]